MFNFDKSNIQKSYKNITPKCPNILYPDSRCTFCHFLFLREIHRFIAHSSSQFYLLGVASVSDYCLNLLSLWWLKNGDYLIRTFSTFFSLRFTLSRAFASPTFVCSCVHLHQHGLLGSFLFRARPMLFPVACTACCCFLVWVILILTGTLQVGPTVTSICPRENWVTGRLCNLPQVTQLGGRPQARV